MCYCDFYYLVKTISYKNNGVRMRKNLLPKYVIGTCMAFMMGAVVAEEQATQYSFYDMALCQPSYSTKSFNEAMAEAEKLSERDSSIFATYIYKSSNNLARDGFESNEVFFAGTAAGILIKGEKADELAAKYNLSASKNTLLNANKNYMRELTEDQLSPESLKMDGKVYIVARETNALKGKTLLACEFVSNYDLKAMQALEALKNK